MTDASRQTPAMGSAGAGPRVPRERASLAHVAALSEVSISTVSRIVNGIHGRAAPETVERVQRAMTELGFRPDTAGRTLRQRQSRIVGVIASNLSNPVMTAVVASLEKALRDVGHGLVLADSRDRPDVQDDCLLNMRAQLVRSIVVIGAVNSPQLDAFRAAHESLLFVIRRDPSDPMSPYVGIDNAAAGRDAASHLLGLGLHRFGVLHSSLQSPAISGRLKGFLDRLAEAGIAHGEIVMQQGEGGEHLSIGYTAMDRMLAADHRPEGLLCPSDLIAYGAHRRLGEAGIAVPDDIRLVGIDGNPLNDWLAPWLPSVHVPYETFGPAIVESLQQLWDGHLPGQRVIPHELIAR